ERVVLDGPGGETVVDADGVIVSGRFLPEATLLNGSHIERDPATGGPVVDSFGRCTDPAYFAAGNVLRPVETAGWSWAEGNAVGKAMRLALENGLAERGTSRVKLVGDALAWAVPQHVDMDPNAALDRLQLRVRRPVKGRLSVR